jgi:hypothetical protein
MKLPSLVLAALLIAAPAIAQTPQCLKREVAAPAIMQRFPGAELHVLLGDEAQAFLALFNAIPPATDLAADEILIAAASPEAPDMRLLLFEDGCLMRIGVVPRRVIAPILVKLSRTGA